MVETVAVIIETGFGIEILCREAVAEEVSERAGLRDGVAEGIVRVLRDSVTGRVKVAGDIAVVVVEWDVDSVIDCKVKQATDAACALQRAGEIFAPTVVDCRGRAVCVGDSLFYEVPIVVEVGVSRCWRDFADAAGLRIIRIGKAFYHIAANGTFYSSDE